MPTHIPSPTIIEAASTPPKRIEEFFGRANSKIEAGSIASMFSPSGWSEPGTLPEFDECTVVLRGMLHVEFEPGAIDLSAGETILAHAVESAF